jgi:hypothetical protein
MAELKEIGITYSCSVKCDLPDPGKGAKSYESTTGFFSFSETWSVPSLGEADAIRDERYQALKADIDAKVEEFYKENSKFAV